MRKCLAIETRIGGDDGVEPGGNRRARLRNALPAFAGRDRRVGSAGLLRRIRRAVRQRHDLFRGRPRRLARGIRIVRRALAAGALTEHAAQAQENEHCERQEDNRINIEHVLHAFGNRERQIGQRPSPIDGNNMAAGSTVTMYAGGRADP